jgi:hypothetical protein
MNLDGEGPASKLSVDHFLSDPCGFFDRSYTAMHSIDRDELMGLQRAGLSTRFDQQASIPRHHVVRSSRRARVGAPDV